MNDMPKIDINNTVNNVREMLQKEAVSPALRIMIELLLSIVSMFSEKLSTNSQNSSKPPSTDPNRKKKTKNTSGKNQARN